MEDEGKEGRPNKDPLVIGKLYENVNKRSEAANRKYRAFIHFLKYQKKGIGNKKDSNSILKEDKSKDGDITP